MPQWQNSTRRDRLPPDWPQRRKKVLRRDQYQCQARLPVTGRRCGVYATDVDHIRAGDNHELENLQSLCADCHRSKSSSEGGVARAEKRKKIDQKFRRTEEHPGLL